MTFIPNIRSRRSMKNLFLCEKKKLKSSINSLDLSSSSSLLSVDNVCSIPAQEDYNDFHKRRKTDKECDFISTNGNAGKSTTRSFTSFGDNLPRVQNCGGKSLIVPSNVEVSKPEGNVEYTTKYKDLGEASEGSIRKSSSGSLSNEDDRNSVSISSMPSYSNDKIKDATEGSSSDTKVTTPFTELTSSKQLCISMLKRDIVPIDKSDRSSSSTTLTHDDNESNTLFACESCGSLEDPCRMLICDSCEGAFHLHCCHRRIKKIPDKEWYCPDCSRKRPKKKREILPKDGSAKDFQRPRRGLGSIGDMLMNDEPYETQARIGRDFQAEVPEWSGPISCSDDYFVESSELDATEMRSLSWPQRQEDKKSSIGNWIQCQEVLHTGAICGKWRRAPLFVVQSSNWDCSCSVLWDPVHADCAVPQELSTDEVLKQLKYINKLKKRLDSRKQKR
uniref:Uncharacterized protein n=1 Tax=Avena sativa TaxID=4498 RepID=A0ACD5ZGL6_AVESA